ncbi:hypothetical protein [Phytoactinopolyspora limicola]|uniref:hypothetical protein n=1 Tax=Phytoactinopolyspora limicola TaxID=2715536 RepID=UPI001A9C8B47|nr:hypothetical protein [Phytoactinopolyspora limicola]
MVRSATVAELCWIDAGQRPDAVPVTPLLTRGRPVVAMPYSQLDLARAVAAAPQVALVVSDPRMTGPHWHPLVVTARPRLDEDRDGAFFVEHLVSQELKKYPPARSLIDSPMLRREHWWYVPRLLITLEPQTVSPLPQRRDPTDLVLAVVSGAGLVVDAVRAQPRWPAIVGDEVTVTSLSGAALPHGAATLLGHDFSVPDLERWSSWVTRGALADGTLRVDEHPARRGLEPTLTLWQRFRRQRRLEHACRRALRR